MAKSKICKSRLLTFSFFGVLFCNAMFAGNPDSLLVVLKQSKQDTSKVNILNQLATSFYFFNPDSTILLSQQAAELSVKLGFIKGQGDSWHNTGIGYYIKGDYQNALAAYLKAVEIRTSAGRKWETGGDLGNIGLIYNDQGDYTKALDYELKALGIAKDIKSQKLEANTLGNIGRIYLNQLQYKKALNYFERSVKVSAQLGQSQSIASTYINMGIVHNELKNIKKAEYYYNLALELDSQLGNDNEKAIVLMNMGVMYYDQKNYVKALKYYQESLKINEQTGNMNYVAIGKANVGSVYGDLGEYIKAEQYLKEAAALHKELGSQDDERQALELLSKLYERTNRPALALKVFRESAVLKDSVLNSERDKELTKKELTFEFDLKEAESKAAQEKKDLQVEEEKNRQKIIIYAVSTGLFLVLLLAIFILRGYRQKQKANKIISHQKREVEEQKSIIEEKNKDITDSITYARRLQEAILPPASFWQAHLPESFVLYQPKDIVAGDFYWMEIVGDLVMFAAADCTGHGVPGAMVSIVCSNALNRSVKEFGLTEPGKILDKVRELVIATFERSESEVKDGMDISLCCYERQSGILHWSGANNPLWILENSQITEVKADKQPIGKYEGNRPFNTHIIPVKSGTSIYIFTDGYADQFGGPKGKKLKSSAMKEFILQCAEQPMNKQKEVLQRSFNEWKGQTEQVDDVCIIGIRLQSNADSFVE